MPLVLDHNLRNTKQIHSSFGPLAPTPMTSRGGDGAEVHFIPAATDAAVEVADEAVGVLLDVGRFPGNIALVPRPRTAGGGALPEREGRSLSVAEEAVRRMSRATT
jgi:hypothetical protein